MLAAGDVCSIAIPDNPKHPFAIGVMHVSTEQATAAGWKGKGVRLLHVLGDGLWAMGDRVMPHPSVTVTQVHPMPVEEIEGLGQGIECMDLAEDVTAGDGLADVPPQEDAVAPVPAAGPADMDALLEGWMCKQLEHIESRLTFHNRNATACTGGYAR